MKNKYIIDDLEEFTLSIRRLVFNGFGKGVIDSPDEFTDLMKQQDDDSTEEMDLVLSQKESLIIVQDLAIEQKHKNKNISRFIISEKIFLKIIDALNARLVSNILASLASKGQIESAYDPEIDDFVFWYDSENTSNEEN